MPTIYFFLGGSLGGGYDAGVLPHVHPHMPAQHEHDNFFQNESVGFFGDMGGTVGYGGRSSTTGSESGPSDGCGIFCNIGSTGLS